MKRLLYLLPLVAVMFTSCEKEDKLPEPGVTTLEATEITSSDATLNGKLVLPEQIANDFEIGFEISKEQSFPEESCQRLQAKTYNEENTFRCKAEYLRFEQTYYVRAYMINQKCLYYGEVKMFQTEGWTPLFVDLGLSVKWATCNVGAMNPEDYGDYFAWGETSPYYEPGYAQENPQSHWKTGKSAGYSWSSYKYCNGNNDTQTKYCQDASYGYNGYTDNKTVLDASDDAASVNWGGSWRMPTIDELNELKNSDYCTWTWYASGNSEFNGIAGYKVTSKKSGYTDKYIFLPAAGYRYDTNLDYVGSYGIYWSSSLDTSYPHYAYGSFFGSGYVSWNDYFRSTGFSVRPVCH